MDRILYSANGPFTIKLQYLCLVFAGFNSRDSSYVAKQIAKYNTMREEEHSFAWFGAFRLYDRTRFFGFALILYVFAHVLDLS